MIMKGIMKGRRGPRAGSEVESEAKWNGME